MSENNNGIELNNVSVGYNEKVLIGDIALSVGRGQIMTLIGPNGVGKSTILKSLTRELKLINGAVTVFGEDIGKIDGPTLARKMSMVMTNRPSTELMTCRDVVATGRYPYTGRFGILSKDDWKAVADAMELVGATDVSSQDFLRISDGQRQRVMLARAICQEPDILILDEPTSFLDIRYKLDILTIIHNLARDRKITVVMSLHELELARGISDLVACVEGNRIGRVGTPDEIFKDGYIQRLYGIDEDSFDEKTGMLLLPKWD